MKVIKALFSHILVFGFIVIISALASEGSILENGKIANFSSCAPDPVKVPVQTSPKNNTEFTHFPRKATLHWRSVSGASGYDVEVDCYGCREAGKWDSEVSQSWQKLTVKVTSHTFTFSGDNLGRWRVRAIKSGRRSDWSSWWTFKFRTGETPEPQAGTPQTEKTAAITATAKAATAKTATAQTAKARTQATQVTAVKATAAQVSAAPKQFFLDFVDAYLIFSPSSNSFQIITEGTVMSYGNDWKRQQLKPYLFHIRQKFWKDFFWQVNTSRKEVYKVTGGKFGKGGGTAKKLDVVVDVVGGDKKTPPERFFLRFKKAYLVYVPASETLQITAEGIVLSYGSDWMKCQMKTYLYHVKLKSWQGFYWKINTTKKKANKVKDGEFCKPGGSASPLKMGVRVVE